GWEGIASRRERRGLLVAAAGAGAGPAFSGQARRQRLRSVAEPEAQQVASRGGHGRGLADAAERSEAAAGMSSRAAAMRLCLSRVSSQKAHEASAPIAKGRRSPRYSLANPISNAPTAGPARKIMP